MHRAKLHHRPSSCAFLPHVIPVLVGVHEHQASMSYKTSRHRVACGVLLRSAWRATSIAGTLQKSVFPFDSD